MHKVKYRTIYRIKRNRTPKTGGMAFYLCTVLLLLGLDQWIKYWVRTNLTYASYIEVIPNFIHLTYQENRGISFSFLSNLTEWVRIPLLAGISTIVVVILAIYAYRRWEQLNRFEKWGFTFLLAGASGNLWDRIFRQQVTDYMFFHFYETGFFVNNLADDLISIGFLLILITGFFSKKSI